MRKHPFAIIGAAVAATVLIAGCSTSSSNPVSSTGFNPKTNGFSFENYGNTQGVKNLDATDLLTLFGDAVCVRNTNGTCVLNPSATQWLQVSNDGMDGGHCFGMAAVAWTMYKNLLNPQDFGGANANALQLNGNEKLQRQIAAGFITQELSPTVATQQTYAPGDALQALQNGWGEGKGYILGFYKMVDGKKTAGHGVTPIAVTDLPDGKKALEIYDNNYPNQTKQMIVDPTTNTSNYTTVANPGSPPNVYENSAENPFQLFDAASTVQTQQCPFCLTNSASSSPSAPQGNLGTSSEDAYNAIYLNQAAAAKGVVLRVLAPDGQPLPDLEEKVTISGKQDQVINYVPANQAFKVVIDATKATAAAQDSDVTIIGPGYAYSVEKIDMLPGEADTIQFSPEKNSLSYETKALSAPDILLAVDGDDKSYNFTFGGLQLPNSGGTIEASLDETAQTATLSTVNTAAATVDFVVEMLTEQATSTYESNPVPVKGGQKVVVDYGKWTGGKTPVPYTVS